MSEGQSDNDFFGAGLRKAATHLEMVAPTIDVLVEEEPPSGVTPFGQGKNLLALRQAQNDVLEGLISAPEYVEKVAEVCAVVRIAVDILEDPRLTEAVDRLDPEGIQVMDQIQVHTVDLLLALETLMRYPEHQDADRLLADMAFVEDELRALAALQAIVARDDAPLEAEDNPLV